MKESGPRDALVRKALAIGISRFGDWQEEPPEGAHSDLAFANERTSEIAKAFEQIGFQATTTGYPQIQTARHLGDLVHQTIEGAQNNAIQVIHVLSHGELRRSGVYVIGPDGLAADRTGVAGWVALIEDHPGCDRPTTLFLIDTCHAGAAARLGWLPAADERTRAWVIAACEDGDSDLAYGGNFSKAVATTVRRIATGDIDFYPGDYIPFVDVVEHVRRELSNLTQIPQRVIGTPVDGLFAPAFFPNVRRPKESSPSRTAALLDTSIGPFLDFDASLDPAHFLSRAGGFTTTVPGEGFFTGREPEFERVGAWIENHGRANLGAVVGSAGSGKSAVMGVLVCALHPGLRETTRGIWERAIDVPAWTGSIAAIHLRSLSLKDVVASIARQFRLPNENISPDELILDLAERSERQLILVDALDEASEPLEILERIILPLSRRSGRGTNAPFVLIGTRPWSEFADLVEQARRDERLVDLDQVPLERLKREIYDYVLEFLQSSLAPRPRSTIRACRRTANLISQALGSAGRGGEFLMAAMYIQWLSRTIAEPQANVEELFGSDRIPTTIPEILEYDLQANQSDDLARAMLSIIAGSRGAGMPASVIRRTISGVFPSKAPVVIGNQEFDRLLQRVRFYVRSGRDSDGTTLYRLFHQKLADQLRFGEDRLDAFLDSLLEPTKRSRYGSRNELAAEPYLRRHWIEHAADAGRLDELADLAPNVLGPSLDRARSIAGRRAASVYRESRSLYDSTHHQRRRDLFLINAIRLGAGSLAARLMGCAPGMPLATVRPIWSTNAQLSRMREIYDPGNGSIVACASGSVGDRHLLSAADLSGTVTTWDLDSGQFLWSDLQPAGKKVTALAITAVDGSGVIVCGDSEGSLWALSATTGQPYDRLPKVEASDWSSAISAVECTDARERPVAVFGCLDGRVRIWFLDDGHEELLRASDSDWDSVSAICVGAFPVASIIAGTVDGKIRAWARGNLEVIWTQNISFDTGVPPIRVAEPADLNPELPTEPGVRRRSRLSSFDAERLRVRAQRPRWRMAQSAADSEVAEGTDASQSGLPRSTRQRGATTAPKAQYEWLVDLQLTRIDGSSVLLALRASGLASYLSLDDPHPSFIDTVRFADPGEPCAYHSLRETPIMTVSHRDGALRVWNLADGTLMLDEFAGNSTGWTSSVVSVRTPGSLVLLTASQDGLIRKWDLTGALAAKGALRPHGGDAMSLTATDDAEGRSRVYCYFSDGVIALFDADNGQPLGVTFELAGRPDLVHMEQVSVAKMRSLVAVDRRGSVHIWTTDLTLLRKLEFKNRVLDVAVATTCLIDGVSMALLGCSTGEFAILDLESGASIELARLGAVPVCMASLDSWPNPQIVFVDESNRLRRISTVPKRKMRVHDVSFCAGEVRVIAAANVRGVNLAVTGTASGWLELWDLDRGRSVSAWLDDDLRRITALGIGVVLGELVVVAGDDGGAVAAWCGPSLREVGRCSLPRGVRSLQLIGTTVAVGYGREIAVLSLDGLRQFIAFGRG